MLKRTDYQLVNMCSDFLELMDQAGRLRDDIRCPAKGERLGAEIAQLWEKGENVLITLLEGMGNIKIISVRVDLS